MKRWSWLVGVALLASAGCSYVAPSVALAKQRGAADLNCPVERVRAYQSSAGTYIARGCKAWAQYDCLDSDSGTICVPHVAAPANPDPEGERVSRR